MSYRVQLQLKWQYKEVRTQKKTIMSYFKVLHNPDIYFKRP